MSKGLQRRLAVFSWIMYLLIYASPICGIMEGLIVPVEMKRIGGLNAFFKKSKYIMLTVPLWFAVVNFIVFLHTIVCKMSFITTATISDGTVVKRKSLQLLLSSRATPLSPDSSLEVTHMHQHRQVVASIVGMPPSSSSPLETPQDGSLEVTHMHQHRQVVASIVGMPPSSSSPLETLQDGSSKSQVAEKSPVKVNVRRTGVILPVPPVAASSPNGSRFNSLVVRVLLGILVTVSAICFQMTVNIYTELYVCMIELRLTYTEPTN
jgi:hypothetical protein